ncbi:MAG TPA: protein kinase [Phycisphaerae bacterium]|nr:protein kinase [Phycisphaerae bacterium]
MKHTQTCPNEERIEQLLLSLTSESETRELTEHLDECEACQKRARIISENAALEDDLHWAVEARSQAPVRIEAPLHSMSEMLPDFEILGELGRGGMGVVYRARQRKLDRLVAVKVLPALLGTVRPDARARFRREAELAASLDHTNIAGVHDFGEVDGTLYYVMQLIEGRSLRDVLNEIADAKTTDIIVGREGSSSNSKSRVTGDGVASRPTYFRKVATWIAEVAEAMQYAHDKGIVHRDIKPSNLILAEDGRLVISDFGLARISQSQSPVVTRGLVGTCRYMSPEQVESSLGPVDAQSDVYSLGATLYELLTFKPLYSCPDERELLRQVVEVDPPPPSRIVPQVPKELETICLKAVAKERRNRYASAGKMAEDLKRWLLDLPIHARRQTLTERAWRFVRRRKLYVLLTTITMALTLTAGGLWMAYNATEKRAAMANREAMDSQIALSLREAHAALDAEKTDKVLEHIRKGLAIDPNHLELNRLKAIVLFRTGSPNEAMAVIRGVIEREPHDWSSHFLAAFAMRPCMADDWTCRCIDRTGLLGENPHDTLTQRYEQHLAEVQEWRSGEAEEFCLLSCKEEDPQLAIALLNSALAKDPTMSEALLLRALRYEKTGELEKMKVDALQAIEFRKGDDLAYGVLGTAQYLLHQFTDAKATLSEAIRRNPRTVLWWYDRAVVNGYLGDFNASIADANTAIGINAKYAFAYVARAVAQVGLKNPAAAMQDYNHAEKLDPRIIDIYIQRCELFLLSGQFEKAMADADRAVKLAPKNAAGYQRRAHAYILTGDYESALAPVNKCLEMDPNDAISLLLKGIIYNRAGEYEQAIIALDQASVHAPADVRIYQSRAQSLFRLERNQEAIADYTHCLNLNSKDAIALMKRGMIYEAIGESRLALADYRRAAEAQPAVRDYADLWSFLLCKLQGDDDRAAQFVGDRFDLDLSADTSAEWVQKLFVFFSGELDFAELLASASNANEIIEANYYGGVMALMKGDRELAVRRFNNCTSPNPDDVVEGEFALARLRAMDSPMTPDVDPTGETKSAPDHESSPVGGISQP